MGGVCPTTYMLLKIQIGSSINKKLYKSGVCLPHSEMEGCIRFLEGSEEGG